MKPVTISAAISAAADTLDGRVYEGYSGRCMYGAVCWGLTSDSPPEDTHSVWKQHKLPAPRWDQLGLGYIYYWPEFEYIPAQD